MGIDEIRPGMVGIGRTVFDGTHVEEFKANILGVLENVIGTRRNLILARLEGGPLANTGVIAGMSGSPVYVGRQADRRGVLLARTVLQGTHRRHHAHRGDDGRDGVYRCASGGRARARRVSADSREPDAAFRRALNWNRPFADRPGDARTRWAPSSIAGVAGAELGTLLRPIATPLVMSGFEPDLADMLSRRVPRAGLRSDRRRRRGSRPARNRSRDRSSRATQSASMLVGGDLQLGATGTVTHVDDDRVYAFGHPLYNLGPTAFPMTRAYVYTVLPSLASSMKLSTTGEVIGSFLQDRAVAIAGRLGPGPEDDSGDDHARLGPRAEAHVPLRARQRPDVHAADGGRGDTRARSRSYERQYGTSTFYVRGTAKVTKHETMAFDNVFAGEQPSINAATFIAAPIAALLGNDYEKVDIESIDLADRIDGGNDDRDARTRLARRSASARRTNRAVESRSCAPIAARNSSDGADRDSRRTPPGTLSVLVADGGRLAQIEQRETRVAAAAQRRPDDPHAEQSRRGSTLYIKLLGSDPGAVVSGESLTALPPSVLGVLEADRSSGSFSPLSNATLGEWELADRARGQRIARLSIAVSPN